MCPAKTRRRRKKAQGGDNQDESSAIDEQYCVSCSKKADATAVGCDMCERWVCNTVMCSGLPKQLLDAINAYDGGGVTFICIKCRIERQSSPSKAQPQMLELIGQLFQQMQGLCSTVCRDCHPLLSEKVTILSSQPKAQTEPTPVTHHPQPIQSHPKPMEQYREMVRDEVKEMQERDKRRQSVIIKGLKARTTEECSSSFKRMTEEVMGVSVTLSDVTPIPNHPSLFRAKIDSDEHRKLVLEKAKHLKESGYSTVFVSRDLTYAQRTELFNRRKARRAEQGAQAHLNPNNPKPAEIATSPPVNSPEPPPNTGN